jgi:hypothetical protein
MSRRAIVTDTILEAVALFAISLPVAQAAGTFAWNLRRRARQWRQLGKPAPVPDELDSSDEIDARPFQDLGAVRQAGDPA